MERVMKPAAASKTKTRSAIVLCIVAMLTIAWSLMTSRSGPSSEPASPAVASSANRNSALRSESLDPRLHLYLLENSEKVKYEGKGINIFNGGAEPVEISKPKVSPLLRQQQEQANSIAHLPPPPPKIPLSYFGISSGNGEKSKAFLSNGDDVWVAREGDVVDRHYKIVRISPTAVEVEDLLNNNRQTISLKQG
jgi:hypothetical protein